MSKDLILVKIGDNMSRVTKNHKSEEPMKNYILTQKTKNKTTSYGIKHGDNILIDNISDNKQEVEELIERINHYDLSPCHLEQIIEDFLTDQYTD